MADPPRLLSPRGDASPEARALLRAARRPRSIEPEERARSVRRVAALASRPARSSLLARARDPAVLRALLLAALLLALIWIGARAAPAK